MAFVDFLTRSNDKDRDRPFTKIFKCRDFKNENITIIYENVGKTKLSLL